MINLKKQARNFVKSLIIILVVILFFLNFAPSSIAASNVDHKPLCDSFSEIKPLPGPELKDGDLVRHMSDIRVWIIKVTPAGKMYKRQFFGPQIFNAYGHLSPDKVRVIDASIINKIPISNLVRQAGDERVYLIEDIDPGKSADASWIKRRSLFLNEGFQWDQIYIINKEEMSLYNKYQYIPVYNGDLIQYRKTSSGPIYQIKITPLGEKYKRFFDDRLFLAYPELNKNMVKKVSLDVIKSAKDSFLVRLANSDDYYAIHGYERRLVNEDAYSNWIEGAFVISSAEMALYRDVSRYTVKNYPVLADKVYNIQRISNGTLTVGVNLDWGGVVSEVVNSSKPYLNMINNHDTGRNMQISLYDHKNYSYNNGFMSNDWGWNPVQGGDKYGHGSLVLEKEIGKDYICVKTRPYEWNPDNKGGGPNNPVLSDVIVEQRVSFGDRPNIVRVQYKVTHLNENHSHAYEPFVSESHWLRFDRQEFPVLFINQDLSRVIYFDGRTDGPCPFGKPEVCRSTLVKAGIYGDVYEKKNIAILPKMDTIISPEYWVSFVDNADFGLTVSTIDIWRKHLNDVNNPDLIYRTFGAGTKGTLYYWPGTYFGFNGYEAKEVEIQLITGDYKQARKEVYRLNGY